MGVQAFERRLERLLEGTFTRTSRAGVQPAELVTRLRREMDHGRTLGTKSALVPNSFIVALAEPDAIRLDDLKELIESELVEAAREHAITLKAQFAGPITVGLVSDNQMKAGRIEIEARIVAGPGGAAGSLVRADGSRVVLGADVVSIGRLPECSIQVDDSQASRRHCEIRGEPDGWVIVDLSSLNGTKLNGSPIQTARLTDGDVISIGAVNLRFEAS